MARLPAIGTLLLGLRPGALGSPVAVLVPIVGVTGVEVLLFEGSFDRVEDQIVKAPERIPKAGNVKSVEVQEKNHNRNGPAQGAKPKSQKQCSNCRKTGHSQEDCYSRKNDKAQCLTVKGDPYYPSSDADWKGPPSRSTKQAAPIVSKGQDFPHWV